MNTNRLPISLTLFLLLFSISIPGISRAQDSEKPEKSAEAEKSESLEVGEFVFTFSKPWRKKAKPRAMTQGGLILAGKDSGDGLEADFYHFGAGQGGSIDANVQRWQGQFEEKPKPTTEVVKVGKPERKVHLVHLEGTYLSGPPFGKKTPVKDQGMLGAILESAKGHVFVKMTGDKKAVSDAKDAFKKLVTGSSTK